VEDKMIVDLYWERSEVAIVETEKKYGKYCHTIAYRILHNEEDAKECVNDTYSAAWDAMPPHKPGRLSTFLGKLTRNIALNRYLHDHAEKRYAPTELVLHEVEEILPDPVSEDTADEIVLKDAINGFLASLPQQTRIIFVRRYWYLSSVKEIARDLGVKESSVKVILPRTRNQFKEYLEKEGINV
jgi:RNA polymerase sigma-70 factor (ECF subfamily)